MRWGWVYDIGYGLGQMSWNLGIASMEIWNRELWLGVGFEGAT